MGGFSPPVAEGRKPTKGLKPTNVCLLRKCLANSDKKTGSFTKLPLNFLVNALSEGNEDGTPVDKSLNNVTLLRYTKTEVEQKNKRPKQKGNL